MAKCQIGILFRFHGQIFPSCGPVIPYADLLMAINIVLATQSLVAPALAISRTVRRATAAENLFRSGCPALIAQLHKIETVKVHDFVPRGDKIMNELFPAVFACVYFGYGAQLGMRAENQINTCARPFKRTGFAITSFK